MSAARGNANHAHYLANLTLAAWRRDETAERAASLTLTQAYLPGVREHLLSAYGWFLLEIAGIDDWPQTPPRSVAFLPDVPDGKALAGELREFQALEATGWLGALLAEPDLTARAPLRRSRANLAQPVSEVPTLDEVSLWHAEMGAAMARMRDSLDEY